MRRGAVLSPRGVAIDLEDLATRGRLIAGQRISAHRLRRRMARRARWVVARVAWLTVAALLAASAVLVASWATRSPRFGVSAIEVTGQSRMTAEEVVAASGINKGDNLFTLDTAGAVGRLESLPLIRRADVIRTFPNRVSVAVEERRPFTLVHAGKLHWIDEEGADLGRESRAVAPAAPVLSGLDPAELGTGREPPSERAALGIALLRLLVRSRSPLLEEISEIDLSRAEGPVLYTVDGVEVRLGKEDWQARLGRLRGVLAQLAASGQSVMFVDLRFRDQVVFKTAVR